MKRAPYVAKFDSSWSLMLALAHCLRGEDFAGLGIFPRGRALAWIVDRMGGGLRRVAYAVGGSLEAISPEGLSQLDVEDISRHVVWEYPKRAYPAAMVGSSNGAAMHLCALMGIPWLPQTYLLPVSRPYLHPDNPGEDLEGGKKTAPALLAANPDIHVHQMRDPVNDRLMSPYFTYFRVKCTRLGKTFRQFLEESLMPGATIFTVECHLQWPAVKISDRHYFQVGGLGDVTPEEYLGGGSRVEEFLRKQGSLYRKWTPVPADTMQPEAEWGFEEGVLDELRELASSKGYRLSRIIFQEPEGLSPVAADIYRWWYEQCSLPRDSLLIEPFLLVEPFLLLQKKLVPYWVVFNAKPSAASARKYLEDRLPFRNVYAALFSHGVQSIGLATASDWEEVLKKATGTGAFIATNVEKYPEDFATFLRFNQELKKLPAQDEGPVPVLPVARFLSFFEEKKALYPAVQVMPPGEFALR